MFVQYGGAKKPEIRKPFVVTSGSHHISSSRAHCNKIPTATHVFEVDQLNSTKICVVGCCLVPEIDITNI